MNVNDLKFSSIFEKKIKDESASDEGIKLGSTEKETAFDAKKSCSEFQF